MKVKVNPGHTVHDGKKGYTEGDSLTIANDKEAKSLIKAGIVSKAGKKAAPAPDPEPDPDPEPGTSAHDPGTEGAN